MIRNNLKLDPSTGRWITPYPYSTDPSILKDNRHQALSILLQVEKRLKKDDAACKAFREQFNDFIERKVIRELSQEEMDNYKGPVNYISIFEVKKEDSAQPAPVC